MTRCLIPSMLAAALTVAGAGGGAWGQDLAGRPIRIVTGSAGGSGDFVARQLAQALALSPGWQVIVDNRPAVQQTDIVLKAAPDGHTVVLAGGPLWVLPLLRPTPYEPLKDFAPVSLVEISVNVVTVHPAVAATTVSELIALAKAKPGALNYATAGVGSTPHLATELFKGMAGINMVHVPYKGSGPALAALLGAQVQVYFVSAPAAAPHVKAGRLRALAVTSVQPSAVAPGLPTVAATVPGYESVGISGLFAPARTPAATILKINQPVVRFLHSAEAKDNFLKNGSETVGSSPEELAATIKKEMQRLGKVIKENNIRAE